MSTSASKTKNRRDFSSSVVSSVGIVSEEAVSETIVTPQIPAVEEKTAPAEQKTGSTTKTAAVKSKNKADDLDKILSMTGKSKRGQQKSVYFDSDVYEYIDEKSRKNGVPFSFVLNLILKEYIKKQ